MRRTLVVLVAALALVGGAGGCGEKKEGDGVASAGKGKAATQTGDVADAAAKYAACMRENGVDMPDPQVDDGKVMFGGGGGQVDGAPVDREKVDAAQQKCKQHLPNGGEPPQLSAEDLDKMRKFSQCMRENGFPEFPDPEPNGGIRIEAGPDSNMDPNSEKWKEAHKTCEQFMPARPGPGGAK